MLCELYDGHTGYAADSEVTEAAENVMFGNDFGFSMMTLSDGRNVAVNIENGSEAQRNGIENGTEILSLNGKSVEECKSEVKYFERIIPDAETEEFYRACYAAGQSGDSMSVDFIDDIGNERTVILNKTGFYRERLKNTIEKVNGGRNIATLSFEELSDTSVLYRIKGMAYDTKSYLDNDYSQLESEFRNSLQSYKDRGFTKLIIDLRDNGGGSPVMIKSLAEIIASEGQHEYAGFGVIDEKTGEYLRDENTGRYLSGGVCSFSGEDLWNHGEIIILVNAYCISAGDHFVNMMYGQDNVRITGFTKSNGSGQGTGSCYLKNGAFSFSKVPTMDAGGEIYIDCGADRKTGVKINEIIPFTEDAVRAVFDRGEDYVLECVK